ncbi:MAG: hypothetical protein K2O32_09605, partial [Acetatifactor sp.]|nr:hypothetical protein [Acetatifactor sp.]
QILKKLDEQEEEEINMCKAWDEIQQEWEEATVNAEKKGMEKGIEKGREEERKEGIRIFILDNIEEGKSGETIVEKLCRRYSLDAESAQSYYNMYGASV